MIQGVIIVIFKISEANHEGFILDNYIDNRLHQSSRDFHPYPFVLFFSTEDFFQMANAFEEDFLGPYSELANSEIEQLRTENIVEKNKLRLTAYGREIAKILASKASEKLLQLISDIKLFLNNLTSDELLGFIYFSYPDFTTESLEFERVKKNRLPISISLFEKRKISQ